MATSPLPLKDSFRELSLLLSSTLLRSRNLFVGLAHHIVGEEPPDLCVKYLIPTPIIITARAIPLNVKYY